MQLYHLFFPLQFAILVLNIFLTLQIAGYLTKIFFDTKNKNHKAITIFTLLFSWIVTSSAVLGLLGILNIITVSATNLIFWAGLYYFNTKNTKDIFIYQFNFHHLAYLPLALISLILFSNASQQIIVESDSLTYHLPYIAKWLQSGNIWKIFYSAYSGPIGYYPANYELLSTFAILPFKEDIFVNLVNFTLFFPIILTLYGILKALRASETISEIAPAFILFSPILLRQANIPQNDLFLFFTSLITLYFLLQIFTEKIRSKHIILFSISLGLFIGTKANAIIYGSIIFIAFLIQIFRHRKNNKEFLKYLGISLIGIIATGAFWYLRNWIITGNPLFPINITIGNFTIFSGYLAQAESLKNSSILSHINESKTLLDFFKNYLLSSGFIGVTAILGILIAPFNFFKKQTGKIHVFLFIISIFFFLIYLISPYSYQNLYPNIRYLLPFILTGNLLFFSGIPQNKKGSIVSWILIVFGIISTVFLIATQKEYLEFTNDYVLINLKEIKASKASISLLLITIFFSFLTHRLKKKSIKILNLILISVIAFTFFNLSFINRSNKSFNNIFLQDNSLSEHQHKYVIHKDLVKAFEYIQSNIPTKANIAYSNFGTPYHLYDKNFQREVDYININACDICIYHHYKDNPHSILGDADYHAWVQNLESANKDYLIFAELYDWSPKYEKIWANQNPEKFTKIYKSGKVYIWKINR